MSSTTLEQQIFSQPESVTTFLYDRVSRSRAPRTVEFYQLELGYFLKWLNRPLEVTQLTPDILRRYFVELATHRNRGGVHCSYRVIRCFLNWYEEEYEPQWKNPIKKIKLLNNKANPLPEKPLTDIQKLLGVVSDKMKLRDTAVLKCLVDSGCRASELLALNIGDINLQSGSVLILHGKGDKRRQTFIGKSARKSLSDYLATRENLSLTSPVFINDEGERLKFFGLRMLVVRLCKRAGVKETGLHAFRRTFALTLWRKGTDILTISRLLGHASIEVTKRYLNIGNEDLQKAHSLASPADSLE